MLIVAALLIGLVVAAAAAVLALRLIGASRLGAAHREREQLLTEANREADTIKREAGIAAREEVTALRSEVQREVQDQRARRIISARGEGPATARYLIRKGFGEDAVETAFGGYVAESG